MLFIIVAKDKPNALDLRMALRPEHLAYCVPPAMKMAGPFLDEEGRMKGSYMIIDVPDRAAAEAWLADEPFSKAGLFQSVTLDATRVSINFVDATF